MEKEYKIFKIYGAYSWYEITENNKRIKNSKTVFAISELIKQIELRVANNLKNSKVKLRYNRLRATAGS
jgi:hypothetical protein